MQIDILTLFPRMFAGPFSESIIQRSLDRGLITIALHDIRDFATGRHRVVDDYAYGGGPGMVMKPEPIAAALASLAVLPDIDVSIVLLTPQGRRFNQSIAQQYVAKQRLILICGHYEGIDERVRTLVDDELSLGDFVLSGGEPAAIAVVDAVVRLVPGVLGSEESLGEESHVGGLLEYPQYTRPPNFRGEEVPAILLSGNHNEVARWRRLQSLLRTSQRRPDLLPEAHLTPAEEAWLAQQKGTCQGSDVSAGSEGCKSEDRNHGP